MRIVAALSVILTALALMPGGAHVAALPNKLGLDRDHYFTVQQIYRGWALFGSAFIAAFSANLATAISLWRRGEPFTLAVLACLGIAASLGIFFIWVYPANVATSNWTEIPANREELRT